MNNKLVIVTHVYQGIDKPYIDNLGAIWVKSGEDKSKVTSKEELRRLFQCSDLVYSDEIPLLGSSVDDIDIENFKVFYLKEFGESFDDLEISLIHLLENLNLAKGGCLDLAGLLLFGKHPQKLKPTLLIKAVSFFGKDTTGDNYRDSEDLGGKIKNQYKNGIGFLKRNLKKIQGDKGINTLGDLEVPEIVLEELLVNAIIHRNYFIQAPIRLFILEDRIEIISPGALPNKLTIENIKNGISIIRNPILTSFATKEFAL